MSSLLTPRKSLNKAYLKVKPVRSDIDKFKASLVTLLDQINHAESEEFNKNVLADFLKNTFYSPNYFINTKGRNDLVIHNNRTAADSVGVIIEAKRTTNASEMIKADNINNKAMQELVLYYLRERITHKNLEVKNLIVTNVKEWFIFDANVFEKYFAQDKKLVKNFNDFEAKVLSITSTDDFYKEIASVAIEAVKSHIEFTYFNINDIEVALRNSDKGDDTKIIPFYKLLSPEHLLKVPFANDSNSLNKSFYTELLHIIGLEETKDSGKKIIARKEEGKRYSGTLIENSIIQIESLDKLSRLPNKQSYGATNDEQLFNAAIELAITWINRILFLKLLEAQLITYHKNDKSYAFLNSISVKDFDELNTLFFQVLAVKTGSRNSDVRNKFSKVPYLNSSLFEPTEIEHNLLFISNLSDDRKLPIISSTVLKDVNGKKMMGELNAIEYLFHFLNSYDFTSEGNEEIQEDNKSLINASVLGLIFEKINGYKDGSFFTPGFVTMYMSREVLRKTVVNKVNEIKGLKCNSLRDIYNSNIDSVELNNIINSIKVCDPAVGSGHFLVSALNEFIAIKSELEVLQDKDGKRLKNYSIEVANDELIISDEDGLLFEYNPTNPASQRVQETLFNEKQLIIENCLFGVDINPNSVKICRLRLWIELLKNTYYKADGELETLPNIDINIKCGNSLISRFSLDEDLKVALKKSKLNITQYKSAVQSYRAAKSKDEKHDMERLINEVKTGFRTEILVQDPKARKLLDLRVEIKMLELPQTMFDETKKEKKEREDKRQIAKTKADKLALEIDEIKSNKIYENAFEWRFEFPEVLDDDGNYIGFDVVIGNPPYIYRNLDITLVKKYYLECYKCTEGNFDLYKFFIERIQHIAKDLSFATYIVSNTFLSAKSFSKLRDVIINEFNVIEIYELGLDVFDEAVVENVILTLQKCNTPKNNSVVIKIDHRKYKSINMPEQSYLIDFRKVYEKENAFNIFLKEDTELLVDKIRLNTTPLSNIAYCTVGINTGYIKEQLFSKTKVDNSYHKVLNGKDIMPYAISWKGDWIKYDKEYVDSFGDLGRSLPPEYIFTSEKILIQRTRRGMKRKLVCAYDNGVYYNLNRLSNIVLTNTDYSAMYVIALLNSKLIDYYFNVVFNEYEVKPLHLSQLPIRILSIENQSTLVDIVKLIFESRLTDVNSNITELENRINTIVYSLYGLTDDDVAVVENYNI